MTQWSEPQKTAIRHYMGGSILNKGYYPLLESAMVTVLAVADGGDQVDNSTQEAIISVLTDIATLETRLKKTWIAAIAVDVGAGDGRAQVDAARGAAMLRMEGRRLSGGLARYLGFKAVLTDIWTPSTPHVPPLIGPDLYSS